MENLKPCPFCGESEYVTIQKMLTREYWYVHCRNCRCGTAQYCDRQEAIKVWNRRMAENKMKQVAALFGKKLGEEFVIKRSFGFDFEGHFSERGFVFWGEDATNNKCWYTDDGRLILELLTGRAKIIEDENDDRE